MTLIEQIRQMDEKGIVLDPTETALLAADKLARATERLGIRQLVAGWNGEAYERPYAPHPDDLGATLQTNCGTLYRIDIALTAYRKAIGAEQ